MKICISNTQIWTPTRIYDWMIIEDGMIDSVGTGIPNFDGEIKDYSGKFIFPGLIDSHIHVFGIGLYDLRLKLNKPSSIAELQTRLLDYVDAHQDLNWIVGYNWDQDYMEDGRYPNRKDIDRIVSNKPVVLYRGCNHILLLNSKALELLNITESTQCPSGGHIDIGVDGQPTGILREKAMGLVSTDIQLEDKELRKKAIQVGLQKCLENGITSVQTNDRGSWEIYNELDGEKQLPIRVFLTMYHDEIESDSSPKPGKKSNRFQWNRIKIVSDGSLGAQTAALREPYSDTNALGLPIYEQDELLKIMKMATSKGYRIETHAIGDMSAELVINAYEALPEQERPILTHCQVLGKDLVEKMKKRGVIANIQPQFVRTDSQWVSKRLGENSERYHYSYAWKTLLENDIHVAGGSDAPIESPNALDGIYQAMFRLNPKNEVWRPKEKLSFNEAVGIYTEGGAYAVKLENQLGMLKEGYQADFFVTDIDLAVFPEKIPQSKILEVWVEGLQSY